MRSFALLPGFLLFGAPTATAQQQLGHKMLGAIGIYAGVQSEPGWYLGDRLVWYSTTELKDRNGDVIPIPGLDLDAYGNMLGLGLTTRLRGGKGAYLSFAAGAPLARIRVSVDDPRTVIDRSGFGDIFVQPVKEGWRGNGYDAVAQYEVYAPTGHFEPRTGSGVGRGFWTHQLAVGGAVFRDSRRQLMSALVSYDLNLKKRGIDIRRGNTVQIQGGAGATVWRTMTVGIAGFALWQVSDDVGADIPPPLRDLSSRGFGLGPEISVWIPSMRMGAEVRFEREFGSRSRSEGQILTLGVSHQLWGPAR